MLTCTRIGQDLKTLLAPLPSLLLCMLPSLHPPVWLQLVLGLGLELGSYLSLRLGLGLGLGLSLG